MFLSLEIVLCFRQQHCRLPTNLLGLADSERLITLTELLISSPLTVWNAGCVHEHDFVHRIQAPNVLQLTDGSHPDLLEAKARGDREQATLEAFNGLRLLPRPGDQRSGCFSRRYQ